MIKIIFFCLFAFLCQSVNAQTGKAKVVETAEKIRQLYNGQKYSEIYSLMSPDFKIRMSEKEFSDFMKKNIFMSYSDMETCEYLNEEKEFYSFIGHFKNGELRMNVNLDDSSRVQVLQFLPHQSMPRLKILNYVTDNPKQSTLDTLLERVVKDHIQSPQNCGFSIGIFENGKDHFYNYGEIKRNSKILATQNSIYEIGSVTKTFCGILLAKAIEEKKVKATDDIRLYLPKEKYDNLKIKNEPIQLIHLANHTSGLPRLPDDLDKQPNYDALNPYKNYDKKMMFSFLKRVSLVSEPGKVCEYSNIGMALLGLILEKVYGRSFDELVKEKICMPLKMNATGISLDEERTKLFCSGYNSEGNETPHWELGDFSAAGGIRSTTGDMLTYVKENLAEKDEALKLSHESTFNNRMNIAMAWHIVKTKQGNKLIWHNGGTFGFSSFCGFIKEKNCAIVILSNSGMPVDMIALAVLKYLQQ